MNYHIDIQQAQTEPLPIKEEDLTAWAALALRDHLPQAELTIRLVEKEDIAQLNRQYRDKPKATNVLAFPCNLPDTVKLDLPLLGDLVICPQVLQEESLVLNQPLIQHWAHIVIHGVLHLLGYDHLQDEDTEKMQTREINLLAELGYANPYEREDETLE